MANDGVIVSHLAVQLVGGCGRSFEVHHDVVAFFVAIDLESELPFVPLASVLHGTALRFDNTLKFVRDLLDLGISVAGRHDVKSFVSARIHGLFGLAAMAQRPWQRGAVYLAQQRQSSPYAPVPVQIT